MTGPPSRSSTAPEASGCSTSARRRSGARNRAGWDGTVVSFDFAIAEECRAMSFRRACRGWSEEIAVLRRDLALAPDGVRRWCPADGA